MSNTAAPTDTNSLSAAFGAPFAVHRTGQPDLVFPLLKMRQLAALQSLMRAARVAAAKKNIAEQKMKAEDATRYLTQIEVGVIEITEIRAWVLTPEGIIEALRLSLGKPPTDDLSCLDDVSLDVLAEAALRVTGWVPMLPPDKAPPANPQ